MKSDEVADQVGEDSAVADRCAESVAAWAALDSCPGRARRVDDKMESNPLYFLPHNRAATCTPEVERWRAYSAAVNNAQTTRKRCICGRSRCHSQEKQEVRGCCPIR